MGFAMPLNSSPPGASEVARWENAYLEQLTTAGLELLLRDNGPGIAPADRERIFEPFFTTRPEAMGLGLYLARKLARLEGGELTCLEAESGALFRLLPPSA